MPKLLHANNSIPEPLRGIWDFAGFRPHYATGLGAAFHTDPMEMLKAMPSSSLDLVMTSPPFALTRKKEYGNEPVERYLDWFMPFCLEIKRLLKPQGSFVLDIGAVKK